MNRTAVVLVAIACAWQVVLGSLRQPDGWVRISDGILTELGKTHLASSDPYAIKTAGISVDRTTGDVYMLANNIGICKSTDQGQTFKLVSGTAVGGRFETCGGINIDPAGGRLMCFAIYGPSGYSGDAGKTWIPSALSHLDFGAVDWSDSGKALLAVAHESGGKLMFSRDSGGNWISLGSGHWGAGLFNRNILVTSDLQGAGIVRSTDGGVTWGKVSDEPLAAPVMVQFKRVGYWLGEHGLLASRDQGASWRVVAPLPGGAAVGPLFGADERHIVVGTPDGLYESKDAGKTWSLVAPLAPEITVLKYGKYATYGWDPVHNIFYASQMAKPGYRLRR
jgi:photosystem II stability/assembly factor-like uncharacterized protein